MKRDKIIYLVATGLLTALMLFSSSMYFFDHEMVSETFSSLGFPTYIIYPLAIAKLLGLVAIWTRKSRMLLEWAYAGFCFDFLLASSAHIIVKDGAHIAAIVALVLLFTSYFFGKRAYQSNA